VSAQVCGRRLPRQERAHDTVSAVVEAAGQLLVEAGYGRASTNAIARRAGVSVGSLYQYFADKEDVFRALVRQHREEVKPVVMAALSRMAEPAGDLVELALDLMRAMARVNAQNPRLMAAIDRELGWLEHDDDAELELSERITDILRRRTSLPTRRIAVTAELMLLTVAPLSRWLVHGKPPALDTELFVAGVGRMLRGLLEG
jgi:AcrR family transcriptional regulator